ncbi:unnamed protein product [Penicillium egyptiacum]|uniref:C2H2-type domain-containing protein n=1 Tax=Penicillium egyptiacum TaxID=1303716 RepID=A0A9W4P607_9EURO|nr:unnamed protein product [Penicillium egyptiacum]
MSQSYNHLSTNTNLRDENGFCGLHGYQPCSCARLYMTPTVYSQHSNHINQSSTYQASIPAPCFDLNCCQSDGSTQAPIFIGSQNSPDEGYNAKYTSMNDTSNAFTGVSSPHIQASTPPSNIDPTHLEGRTVYYKKPAQSHNPEDPQVPLRCYWKGFTCEHGLMFPNIESLMNHVEMSHINPQLQANQQSGHIGGLKCSWKECTSAFSTKGSLARHIRWLHVNPSSFLCPFCDKCFNREDNLEDHLSKYHRISTWWRRCKGECY